MVHIGHQLALCWYVRRPVAEPELSLQSVKVRLQGSLLLSLGGLGGSSILAELLQASLRLGEGILLSPVIQPRQGLCDPLQQLHKHKEQCIIKSCTQKNESGGGK